MDDKMKIVAVAIVTLAAMAIIGYALITTTLNSVDSETSEPGEFDELAACLTEKGYFMMGAEWCSACNKQKQVLGNSFELIDYRDCDKERDFCTSQQVQYFPTWSTLNGEKIVGVQTPEQLAAMAGC